MVVLTLEKNGQSEKDWIAVMCLALNLIMSSGFIMAVKALAGDSVENEVGGGEGGFGGWCGGQ